MKLNIKDIVNVSEWEKFLLEQQNTPFFQSWHWGEVQKKSGHEILRWGIYQKNKLIGIVQIIKVEAKRGKFFWIRHGPILKKWDWNRFKHILMELKAQAEKNGVMFLRIAPLLDDKPENYKKFQELGFSSAPIHNMDAENAWVVELSKSENELLKDMRKTTRYLIKKAQSLGVEVKKATNYDQFNDFLQLYKSTAIRQHFNPHHGIKEEYDVFTSKNLLTLYLAYYKNQLVAGAMIIFYGNEAVYHHSALDAGLRHIPASYLIQWEAIKEAKKRGLQKYNLWGIAPKDKRNHPWQGLTIFKSGFGGGEVNHIHAQDLPLSPLYWMTWSIETIRRIKKGY